MISKLSSFSLFIYKIRKELFSPTKLISKKIVNIINLFRFQFTKKNKLNLEKNILIWDIRTNSITFDFVWVIFNAFFFFECPREGFQIIIFKPEGFVFEPFNYNSYNKYVSSDEMINRFDKLILVIAKSFSCINKITIETDKKKIYQIVNSTKNILPKYYHPDFYSPEPLCYKKVHDLLSKKSKLIRPLMDTERLKKTLNYKYLIKDIGDYVTFSIRDYGYFPERNISQKDLDISLKFSKKIGCKFVVIPDNIEKLKNYDLSGVDLVLKVLENIWKIESIYIQKAK